MLADIEAVLPGSACTRTGDGALVLNLVNSVGVIDLPEVGPVELYSGKLGEAGFEALLATRYSTTRSSICGTFSRTEPRLMSA